MAPDRPKYHMPLPILVLAVLYCAVMNQLQAVNAQTQHGDACNSTNPCQQPYSCKHNLGACLCPDGQYYDVNHKLCEPDEKRKIVGLKCRGETDTVICELNQNEGFSVIYKVKVNNTNEVTFSQGEAKIKNLTPGSYYGGSTTSTVRDFDKFYKSFSSGFGVWTTPDKPGNNISVSKINGPSTSSNSYRYNIMFGAPRGNVRYYIFMINTSKEFEKKNLTETTFRNVALKPGTKYQASITSYNGNNTPSDVTTTFFTTDAEKSGKVRIAIDQAPCTTDVSWSFPEDPNGQISHYQVSVTDLDKTSTCVWKCILFNETVIDVSAVGVNCSTDNFKTNDTGASIRLLGLEPNHTYNVSIAAVNEVGIGLVTSEKITTNIAAADVSKISLSSVRYNTPVNSSTRSISLTISWTPSTTKGDISYNVQIMRAKSRNSNEFVEVEPEKKGIVDTQIELDDVLAHWNYTASVQAVSCKGTSSKVWSNISTTAENNPGQVQNLIVMQDDKEAQIVKVKFDCLNETVQNGIIKKYVLNIILLNEKASEVNDTKQHEFLANSCGIVHNLPLLKVEKQYQFTVKALNQNYSGEYSEAKHLTAVPKTPLISEKCPDIIIPKSEGEKINVPVKVSCLMDSSQGSVEHSGLIVCVKADENACANLDSDYKNYITWKQALNLGFTKPYRTTRDDWKKNLETHSNNYSFEVGVDSNCDTSPEYEYCNGPLPGGKKVILAVVVCTKAGCDYVQTKDEFYIKISEVSKSNTALVIALTVVVIIVLICAVAVFVSCRLAPKRWSWLIKRNTEDEPEIPERKPIKMRDFEERVKKLHRDSNLLMQGEFEDIKTICMTFKSSCNEAQREANRVKNRYVDILPYFHTNDFDKDNSRSKDSGTSEQFFIDRNDHSRVKLDVPPEGEETNDFINANYIPGLNSVREYIATQGPMHCTFSDFWRMIWEQKCQIIVMVSDLQENGRLKVDQYWPENLNEPVTFENVVVEMTNFSQLNKYIIRSFALTKGTETRKVTQFFLPGWCDFSANVSFDEVLDLVKLMRQEITPDTSGPITVHCSAGVGRTGTFIALDYFMQYVDEHSLDDYIDIYDYVLKMRRNRPRMVQAESQYIFIYDAVKEIIKKKIQKEEEKLYDTVNSDSNASLAEVKPNENMYVEIQLDDEKCAYINEAFEPDNSNTEAEGKQDNPEP